MDIADARKLAEYLNASSLVKERRYNAGNLLDDGAISEFGWARKYWRDTDPSIDKPCVGAFLISTDKESIWALLVQWLQSGEYYLVLYRESPRGRPPVCELRGLIDVDGIPSFRWKYIPRKQDGRNSERKAIFQKIYGSDALIPFPLSREDVHPFAENLVALVKSRIQADALDDVNLAPIYEGTATTERRYWIYAPGENSRKWDEFYKQGVMGIGWDDLGDLTQYPDRE